MFKRILAVALAIVMVMAMAAVAVSAAEVSNSAGADNSSEATGTSGVISFNTAGWNNTGQIYCHIWEQGAADFYGWGSPDEKCENTSGGTIWQYDLSKLDASTENPGGLKAGKDYCVIFHDGNTKVQTYDLTFGTECIGDMVMLTGNTIENPVDSEKKGYEAKWVKNSSKYGPHLAISSLGNFIGSVLCPNESGTKVIGDWLVSYSDSPNCDAVEVVAKALQKFGVKDIEAVYAYILTKDLGISNPDTMLTQLEEAYKIAYPNETEKKIDKEAANEKKEQIEANDGNTAGISEDEPAENSTGSTSTSGSTGVSSGSGSNSSGTGADGQNDTILFVLAAVMLVAAGAFVASRKRTEV